MRHMEDIRRTRHIGVGKSNTERKNYIQKVWNAMAKTAKRGIEKAEDNPVRTQLWANVILTLSVSMAIPFFAWLGFHLIDFGEQKANQKFYQQQNEEYKKQVEQQQKEIEALKQQANEQQETVAPKPKQPSRKSQNARGSKPKINGQVKKLDYAKYANFRLSL